MTCISSPKDGREKTEVEVVVSAAPRRAPPRRDGRRRAGTGGHARPAHAIAHVHMLTRSHINTLTQTRAHSRAREAAAEAKSHGGSGGGDKGTRAPC
eukprot:5523717-Pleurochrysis_carterae.AAC.1